MARHSWHTFLTACLFTLSVLGIYGCGDDGESDDKTSLRFINTVTDLPGVDLLVDFEVYFDNVRYLQNSGYFEMNTDPHVFQVTPSNSLTPIDQVTTTLSDSADYTYLVYGSSVKADAMLLKDDNDPPGDDAFRVRIIDVALPTRSLDVYIVIDPRSITSTAPTGDNLRYKSTTSYLSGQSGTYSVIVTDSRSGEVLGTARAQNFDSKGVYTVLIADPQIATRSDRVNVVVLTDRAS